MANTIKINVDVDDTPVKSLKAQLKETVLELQRVGVGGANFDELNKKAAAIKDQMAEVNEQIAVFATGSKYEQVSNSLGEIGAGIRDMDFDRVTQGAKLFQKTAGSITFKDALGSLKQLGSAFASIGKTILTNPLFLLVAVVGAIVAAIVALMDELGILKDIFEAIGKAVGWVIQQLKDFLDWIGLTTFAAEDAADRQTAALKKTADAYEQKAKRVTAAYDQEIRMAQLDGKNTVEMEIEKAKFIKLTAIARAEEFVQAYKAAKLKGDLSQEELDDLRKKALDQIQVAKQAQYDIDFIRKKDVVDHQKANDEKAKANAAAAEKRRAEREKEREEERIHQEQLAKDRLAMEEGFDIAIQQLEADQALKEQEKRDKEAADLEAASRFRIELMEHEVALQEEADAAEIERKKLVKDASLNLSDQVLSGIAANLKEGSGAAKAVAVAQATMDTYRAATAAFASTAANPITVAFPAAPYIAAASAVAMGIANVRKILAVEPKKGGGGAPSGSGSGGQAPSFGSPQTQETPQMNLNTGVNQTASSTANRERVIVVDYHDIADKGNELQKRNQKVTLA